MKIADLLCESPEARIEYIAKTMGQKLVAAAAKDHSMKAKDPHGISAALAEFDPTVNKKALNFIAKIYVVGAIRDEDKNKIKASLNLFFQVSNKLENKDLMSYKTLDDLYDALEPFEKNEKDSLSAKQQKKLVKSDAEKLIDTADFKVIIPKSEAAATYYGANTKWCTAADKENMFAEYHSEGPIYIIIAGSGASAKKFQFHYESAQFMNARDVELNARDIKYLSKFPQYREFLDMLITKHYGELLKRAKSNKKLRERNEVDLFSLHTQPETLKHYDDVHDNIPRFIIKRFSRNAEELRKREEVLLKDPANALMFVTKVIRGPYPKAEPIIATWPHTATTYAMNILKGRFVLGEKVIIADPHYAKEYAIYVIKGRWPEAEDVIARDYDVSDYHEQMMGNKRWPAREKFILSGKSLSYSTVVEYNYSRVVEYARDIIKGRWPEAEKMIATNPSNATQYAIEVLKEPFTIAHKTIAKVPMYRARYEKHFGIDLGKLP